MVNCGFKPRDLFNRSFVLALLIPCANRMRMKIRSKFLLVLHDADIWPDSGLQFWTNFPILPYIRIIEYLWSLRWFPDEIQMLLWYLYRISNGLCNFPNLLTLSEFSQISWTNFSKFEIVLTHDSNAFEHDSVYKPRLKQKHLRFLNRFIIQLGAAVVSVIF